MVGSFSIPCGEATKLTTTTANNQQQQVDAMDQDQNQDQDQDQNQDEDQEQEQYDPYTVTATATLTNLTRIARALQIRRPVLLEGPPGVGKSSIVAHLAKLAGHTLVR